MNDYYVYEWIRLDTNEPFYVGMGHGDRCYQLTRGKNNHFNNIVKSIPIAVNILHNNLERQMAFDLEVWYIREYRDIIGYNLCNINDGGEGQTLCGESNGFYGKQHSDETKQKMSEIKKGKPLSEEHKKKIVETLKGRHHSEETKKKIGDKHKNKFVSEETKKKISENHANVSGVKSPKAKSVICLTTKRIFYTVVEGAKYYNLNRDNIANCCKGRRKFYGEYNGKKLVWKYLVWKHNKKYRIMH